jgi:UDP-N-acetylmuramate--alanine ligase
VKHGRPSDAGWPIADRSVYFVGIGGCGMSGLARMLHARGARCSGSDRVSTPVTDALTSDGFDVSFDQESGAIPMTAT